MQPPVIIAASILSADHTRLQEEVESIETLVDWLQIDVMDGRFVPNVQFADTSIIAKLRTSLPLDVHLMVEHPLKFTASFLPLHPKNITFHAEAVEDTNSRRALMKGIRDGGATAGIALNPNTPVSAIDDVIDDIDIILIMSVEPGFGGQAFIPEVLAKVSDIRARFPSLMIQMDGGITAETAKLSVASGANNLVAGSFIFSSPNRAQSISEIRAVV